MHLTLMILSVIEFQLINLAPNVFIYAIGLGKVWPEPRHVPPLHAIPQKLIRFCIRLETDALKPFRACNKWTERTD